MTAPDDTFFPDRLRQLRTAAKLTQLELAVRAGVHVGAVHKWEHGSRRPHYDQIAALAHALGVRIDQLFPQ